MNTTVKRVLENALKVLSDNKDAVEKDGYHALAADMGQSMREISDVLVTNVFDYDPYKEKDRPSIGRGLDGKLYLVFKGSWDAGQFLKNLGIDEFSVPLHHFGGYENAILVDTENHNRKGFDHSKQDDCLAVAETWFRAISTWLLENDHDMTLPDGILDTDPLDLAESIHKYRTSQ